MNQTAKQNEIKVGDTYKGATVLVVGVQGPTIGRGFPVKKNLIGRKYVVVQSPEGCTYRHWIS